MSEQTDGRQYASPDRENETNMVAVAFDATKINPTQPVTAARYRHIPSELQAGNWWMVARGKEPYQVMPNGSVVGPRDVHDPAHHCSFEQALAAVEADPSLYLGCVLGSGNDFVCVDLDPLDKVATVHRDGAGNYQREIRERLDGVTYCEVSQSGNGFHYVGRWTDAPAKNDRHPEYKVDLLYHKFLVLTGDVQGGTAEIVDISATMRGIINHLHSDDAPAPVAATITPAQCDEIRLISILNGGKNGPIFRGEAQPTDWSESYAGFLNTCAEFCTDAQTVQRVLLNSKFVQMVEDKGRESRADKIMRLWDDEWPKALQKSEPKRKAAAATGSEHDWPEPVDVLGSFDPPDFPVEAMPVVVADFAKGHSVAMGADKNGLALACLCVAAGAIPDSVKIAMKPGAGWFESARIWGALVGGPSTIKTPVMNATKAPLERIERELAKQHRDAVKAWSALSKDEQRITPEPIRRRVVVSDTTVEAHQNTAASNPAGVFFTHGELARWFGQMENGGVNLSPDRPYWLQAFDGGSYTVDRVKRGHVYIDNLSVSLLGAIQPETIAAVDASSFDDGLFQRLFPVVLRDAAAEGEADLNGVNHVWESAILALHSLPETELSFDPDAQKLRNDLSHEWQEMTKIDGVNPKLASHIGKLRGLFGRLCVALHCLETFANSPQTLIQRNLPPEVTAATAEAAGRLINDWLLPNAYAFYAGVLDIVDPNLKRHCEFILANPDKPVLVNRDLQRGHQGMTAREAREAFERLESIGWVQQAHEQPRRDSLRWDVNPKVHQKFAEKAARITEKRKATYTVLMNLQRLNRQGRS